MPAKRFWIVRAPPRMPSPLSLGIIALSTAASFYAAAAVALDPLYFGMIGGVLVTVMFEAHRRPTLRLHLSQPPIVAISRVGPFFSKLKLSPQTVIQRAGGALQLHTPGSARTLTVPQRVLELVDPAVLATLLNELKRGGPAPEKPVAGFSDLQGQRAFLGWASAQRDPHLYIAIVLVVAVAACLAFYVGAAQVAV